jgi:DNA invertase Pin-like site-specific DNA recombinase
MKAARGAIRYETAVIYLRVSTEEQARSGLGREAQEAKCRAYCERQGYEVVSVFIDDGRSGKLPVDRRPGLKAAVEHVRRTEGAVLVIYALSRAFRSQGECWRTVDVEQEQWDTALPLVSATEPFDLTTPFGRAALGMLVTFATLEADLASERTRDALAAAKARGVRLGAPSMTELAPETVARVRELYATGKYSHRSLADHLNATGVSTVKGIGRWWPKTVAAALAGAHTSSEEADPAP